MTFKATPVAIERIATATNETARVTFSADGERYLAFGEAANLIAHADASTLEIDAQDGTLKLAGNGGRVHLVNSVHTVSEQSQ